MEFIIATSLSVLAVAIAYRTLRNQNRGEFKRLHYTSYWHRLVLPDLEDIKSRLSLSVAGYDLAVPTLVAIRLENTGMAAISPADFSGPLKFKFGTHAYFMLGSIKANREDLIDPKRAELEWDHGDLFFSPLLLNPRDKLTLVAVVDGYPDGVDVVARIAGVEEVQHLAPPHDGTLGKLEVTSMLYHSMDDWPQVRFVRVNVLVTPVLADPLDTIKSGMEMKFAGKPTGNPYQLTFVFQNVTNRRLGRKVLADPIKFSLERSVIVDAWRASDESSSEKERSVWWTRSDISILPPSLDVGQSATIFSVVDGDCVDLIIANKPSWIDNVEIGRMSMDADSLIEDNLAETRWRILLLDSRLHAIWYRIAPKVSRKIKQLKWVVGRLQKRLMGGATR